MTHRETPELKDVDGTTMGRASLIAINLEDAYNDSGNALMRNDFDEGDDADPMQACERLRESIEGDWPEHIFTIVGNERANYLRWARLMKECGIESEELTPQEYLELL